MGARSRTARGLAAPSALALPALALAAAVLLGACRASGGGERADGRAWELVLRGNESVSDRDVRRWIVDELADFPREDFAQWVIDDAAFSVAQRYRDAGFPFVLVEYEYAGPPPAPAPIRPVLVVAEGPRTVLADVAITGARAFDAGELGGFFAGPRAGLLGTGPTWFVRSTVEDGAGALESFYVENGYRDARVEPPEVAFSADRTAATVRVRLHEGPLYRLAAVDVVAAEGASLPVDARALETEVRPLLGRPFSDRLPYEARAMLEDELAARGYADARVETDVDLGEEPLQGPEADPSVVPDAAPLAAAGPVEVRVRCTVQSGPRVRLGRVVVRGAEKTRESFVRSRLELAEGDVWSRAAEQRSFRALYRSGLFKTVRLELVGTGEQRDLLVELEENPSTELWVEPGYGSYEKLRLRLGWRQSNLFGTGRIFETRATAGTRARRFETALTDPWFLGSEWAATLSGFVGVREEPSFTSVERGGGLSFARQWTARFKTTFGYQLTTSDTRDVSLVTPELAELEQRLDVAALTFHPTWDSRDDFLAPTSGSLSKHGLEWSDGSLGSEIDFVRLRLGQSWFRALSDELVLGLSARTGIVWTQEDVLPLQERFFNGGENSVRSFREDDLGPKDTNGEPIGGEAFSVLTAELRRDLVGRLSGAVFADAGNVTRDAEDWLDFEGFRYGVGLGLRYLLPVGPIRLDGAVNPDPRDEEDDWAVHLSIGMSF